MTRSRQNYSNSIMFSMVASASLLLTSSLYLIFDEPSFTISYDPTKPPSVVYGIGLDAVEIPCELVTEPAKVIEGYYSFSCLPPAAVQESKDETQSMKNAYEAASGTTTHPCRKVTDPTKVKKGYTSYICALLPVAQESIIAIKPASLI